MPRCPLLVPYRIPKPVVQTAFGRGINDPSALFRQIARLPPSCYNPYQNVSLGNCLSGRRCAVADVDTLIGKLGTGDYYSRSTAARALGEIGGEKATAALIEALKDEDDWVKEYAAEALG
ncbi:MAG: HEAT repeat domain-containing protein, partial [Candidatus Hydrogenedentota bacterium]